MRKIHYLPADIPFFKTKKYTHSAGKCTWGYSGGISSVIISMNTSHRPWPCRTSHFLSMVMLGLKDLELWEKHYILGYSAMQPISRVPVGLLTFSLTSIQGKGNISGVFGFHIEFFLNELV